MPVLHGPNGQTELMVTSLSPSTEAAPDIITITRQDKHSEAIHVQHQEVSVTLICLNYYCRVISEKLLVTAKLRFPLEMTGWEAQVLSSSLSEGRS